MHFRNSALLALCVSAHAATFSVVGPAPGAWPLVLSSVGHTQSSSPAAELLVATSGTPPSPDWQKQVNAGAVIILEGFSPLAASFGFRSTAATISVIHVVDVHNAQLPIIWAKPLEMPVYEVPAGATVFARDRWTGAPLVAGMKVGSGGVLWVAASPGASGYERFPYLMQSLADLGVRSSFRSSRLWAFFDYSYRSRADVDYLAEQWRRGGISALHVAAWHFYDSDSALDEYLRKLIAACHSHGVLVYAWLELPHVSEKFWDAHPEWREKTGLLQDAQLDWRKLMNLQNPACAAAIRTGLTQLASRFDWDGVNMAELYFESLEGAGNPARFTPMNSDVRETFRQESGWDPVELWGSRKDGAALRTFLDFRAELVRKMQHEWLGVVESFRRDKPDLDIVLTHVDDRFADGMRDAIGADAARVLPLLDQHSFSFLIEDPATVWNLGPQRYPEIAKRYQPLTTHTGKLAIDINIVDRYQDVYPTKQQTGTELFELVHLASSAFHRVALYFENSILKPDMALLSSAAANVATYTRDGRRIAVDAPGDFELRWSEPGAMVDGRPWPLVSTFGVRLPAGAHTIEPLAKHDQLLITDLNAELRAASTDGKHVRVNYTSDSRAVVTFNRKPLSLQVDGAAAAINCEAGTRCTVLLPRGAHQVTAE